MKKVYLSAGISLILSFPYIFLVFHEWNFLLWTNALFYLGLIYLLIGSIILVWSSNFFSAFIHSFKHFFRVINKKEQIIQEIEGKVIEYYPTQKKPIPPKPWIYIGLCYCLISILFSLQIVYFGR
ncbi:hypothetical protein AN964_17415 [Heyndrickxia shackletonii]|uniref:DUF3899 domain-containing protein n=1 Tax=Heyndrickxia shackletonii TaxID=157838 RepID=A0A0Q3TM84_9BACI|nr:hypothetical protein AN964_17415 [Heyndrickxia shackletonii]NEY98825.1 DUF3899 domain-containing protein [Heyndrickxia shackletonii]